jgi:hypothetical protein
LFEEDLGDVDVIEILFEGFFDFAVGKASPVFWCEASPVFWCEASLGF